VVRKFDLQSVCRRPEVGITETDTTRRAREIALLDQKGKVLRRMSADEFRRILNKGLPFKRRLLSARIDAITPTRDGITIEGGGFGHGVGLCQYGARGLARRGDDYKQILDFYYEDCAIARLSDLQLVDPAEP
jgi:stage II sporulation protein D